MLVAHQLDTRSRDAPLARYKPEAHWRQKNLSQLPKADRAACATRTHVTRYHRRKIGQMTANRVRNAG